MTTAALIAKHRPLALGIARRFWSKAPWHVERQEVEHLAVIGLFEWLRTHPDDGAAGWRFGAVTRIRGRILDDLRTMDSLSRGARAQATARGDGRHVVGLDDVDIEWEQHFASASETPEDVAARNEAVTEALRAPLIERDRQIIRMAFFGGRRLQDVAAELGSTEPRVLQCRDRALLVMRAQLGGDRAVLVRARANQRAARQRTEAIARKSHRDGDPPSGIYPKETRSMPVPIPASTPLPTTAIEAVTATLPEEGLDLPAEMARYQAWLVDQALIRTNGNRAGAARLLGINRTTLVEMLRREPGGTWRSRRHRAAEMRALRDTRKAAGQCWNCGDPLDGTLSEHGSHKGLPHGRCASCRGLRRGLRNGTLNAHPKNDHR